MKAVQAMMNNFRRDMQAMTNRLITRLDGRSRARPSSPAPQQPSPSSSNQATQSAISPTSQAPPQLGLSATVTQQQSNSPVKQKRNKRTRQQYKRRALHVTVQPSVKEMEHAIRVKHGNKPDKHVVLQRIKLIAWD